MSRNRLEGRCHICGAYGPLSFEHVPPRAAFNDRRVISYRFDDLVELGPDAVPKGPISQRGAGGYTLCHRCNSNTGSWYGSRFVDWCYQGVDVLLRSKGHPTLVYLNYLFPLSIIKQIVVMFFSVNPPTFAEKNPDLVRFVLLKEAKYLPPQFSIYAYYHVGGGFRYMAASARLNIFRHEINLMSEISFPPFGYLMTINSKAPDSRLVEITHFSRFSYNEFSVMEMQLPALETHLAYPGDYRSRDEIIEQRDKSKADSAGV